MPLRLCFVLAALSLAATLVGCSRDPVDTGRPKRHGTLQTVADGITGRTAVETGRHARDEIERIANQRDQDLEAVLGD